MLEQERVEKGKAWHGDWDWGGSKYFITIKIITYMFKTYNTGTNTFTIIVIVDNQM
jgi:hypothetical protein